VAKTKADPYAPTTTWLKIKNPAYTQGEGRWELFQKRRLRRSHVPPRPIDRRRDAELLRLASLRRGLLLSGHVCLQDGDRCPDGERAVEVIAEIARRYPLPRPRETKGHALF
jgi:hypothetical protein